MVYLPTFGCCLMVNVAKYTIHGYYGQSTNLDFPEIVEIPDMFTGYETHSLKLTAFWHLKIGRAPKGN